MAIIFITELIEQKTVLDMSMGTVFHVVAIVIG